MTDGSQTGTVLVKDINENGSSAPRFLTAYNDQLFFVANDGFNGTEVWHSDGTIAGTQLLTEINPSGDADPQFLTEYGGMLYFSSNDGIHGSEVWRTN